MCRFHRLDKNLSKGSFPSASDRPIGGCNNRPSSDELPRRLPGIPLASDDHEKTAFVTPIGNYHYKVMSFGLKNVGSTYQKMMMRMFEPQLGKNIEVYIDDIVVKSKVVSEHVGDLRNIFEILSKHELCLNTSKCSFGVGSGNFLGYMLTHRGIEVNLTRLRRLKVYNPLGIPKKFKS